MKRGVRRTACAAFVLLASMLAGCEWKQLVVQIDDFETNLIAGVQLWRAEDAASQSFTAIEQILFLGTRIDAGTEMIEYLKLDAQDQSEPYTYAAKLVRGEAEPGGATIYFVFAPWPHAEGWVRVSTFNAIGESELSDEAVLL